MNVDGSISAKLDNKKAIELSPEQARHIDYGYAVERGKTFSVDRVIVNGDHHDVSRQKEALSHLSPGLGTLSVHTPAEAAIRIEPAAPKQAVEMPDAPAVTPPSPSLEREGYGIGF